jgi:hypothetical protein
MSKRMTITFDVECMPNAARNKMEDGLLRFLRGYGWSMWAQGTELQKVHGKTGSRDIALDYCPNMECEHWDGHSGCDATKSRCVMR